MSEVTLSRRESIRKITALGVAVAAATIGASTLGITEADAAQLHMTNALNDLQSALSQLEAASSDKAGHRVQAIGLVKQAIVQVTKGMAAGAI